MRSSAPHAQAARAARVLLLLALVLSTIRPATAEPPRIGLVYSKPQAERLARGDDPLLSYRRSVEEAGGIVVALGVPDAEDDPRALIESVHGLLLPGGVDVNPRHYRTRASAWLETVDDALDDWEMTLVSTFVKSRRPVLGICRGEQLLNVALGGSLYQDLPRERGRRAGVRHRVSLGVPSFHQTYVVRGTLLHSLLGVDVVRTNSSHHQAVRRVGKGLTVSARAADGVVEGVEGGPGGVILGVQFHPERLRQQDPRFRKIFTWLVEKAQVAAEKVAAPAR